MPTLGIDYGGKYTGLAVVDCGNKILYAKTLKLRTNVENQIKTRRSLRSQRRSRKSKNRRLKELTIFFNQESKIDNLKLQQAIYTLVKKRGWDYADFDSEVDNPSKEQRDREEVLSDIKELISKAS